MRNIQSLVSLTRLGAYDVIKTFLSRTSSRRANKRK